MIPKWTIRVLLAALPAAALVGGCDKPADSAPGDGTAMRLEGGQWAVEDAAATAADTDLARIRALMSQGKHGSVVAAVKKHGRTYSGQRTNEEALHLAGQAELASGNYYQAYEWFEKQLAQYAGGTLMERGLLGEVQAGEALMQGKKRRVWGVFWVPAKDEGRMILERVVEHAPGTPLAEKVLLRLADWRYDRGEYAEAVEVYDQFVNQFPRSAQTGYAFLRGARASALQYRGAEFDERPLIEAQQRYAIVQEQFPELAKRERVAGAMMEIREQQAAKSYEAAEFYARTRQTETAVYYYRKTIETFPDTRYATEARAALSQWGLDESPPPRRPVARVDRVSRVNRPASTATSPPAPRPQDR